MVNFIEPRSSRGKAWGPPRNEYERSKHHGDYYRPIPPWNMTHSPHPRTMKLIDDDFYPPPGSEFAPPFPPPGPPRSPRNHFAPMFEDKHPDSHYAQPFRPAPFYDGPEQMPEMFFDSDDSSQHVPSPTDPPTPDSPATSEHSFHSVSASSIDSPTFHEGYPINDPRYFDARRSPSPMELHGQRDPPFRPRRQSFDHGSMTGKSSANLRSVRFNENPVLPDPPARRKGWWNRRGDQLWNNDGAYRAAPEHDYYPPDLRNYPEPGMGWMNEEGVQIDTQRRLVRKKPLRSALKKNSSF